MPMLQRKDRNNVIDPYDFDDVSLNDSPSRATARRIIDLYHGGQVERALAMADEHLMDLDGDALLKFDQQCKVAGATELSDQAFARFMKLMADELFSTSTIQKGITQ